MFRTRADARPVFTDTLELDLATVEPSLAGPKRPQDRVALGDVAAGFAGALDERVQARPTTIADALSRSRARNSTSATATS